MVEGFKYLGYETEIKFCIGEETIIYLRYERLFGFSSYTIVFFMMSNHVV